MLRPENKPLTTFQKAITIDHKPIKKHSTAFCSKKENQSLIKTLNGDEICFSGPLTMGR